MVRVIYVSVMNILCVCVCVCVCDNAVVGPGKKRGPNSNS